MTKNFIPLFYVNLVILLSLLSCSSNTSKDSQKENTKSVLIINHSDVELISKNKLGFWTPKTEDFDQIQSIIEIAIIDGMFDFLKKPTLEIINGFYRQYVCYFNEKKEKIVYVNAFCEIKEPPVITDSLARIKPFDWRTRFLMIHQQNNFCYWNIKINLSTGEYEFNSY